VWRAPVQAYYGFQMLSAVCCLLSAVCEGKVNAEPGRE
jgi:hypothetical protein